MTDPKPYANPRTYRTLRQGVTRFTDLTGIERAIEMPDSVIAFHAGQLLKNLRRGHTPDDLRQMLHEVLESARARQAELVREAAGSQYDHAPEVAN